MKEKIIIFVAISCLMFVYGCTAAKVEKPAYIDNPRMHPVYKPAQYITAVGLSQTNMADAENNAKAKVAEQIKSSITSEVSSIVQELQQGDSAKTSAETKVDINVKAEFSHAELIKIANDAAFTDESNKIYYAFAYLPRGEALTLLEDEYKNMAAEYRATAEKASDENSSYSEFMASYKKLEELFAPLSNKALEIRAISHNTSAEFSKDAELYRKAEKTAQERIASLNLNLNVTSNDSVVVDSMKSTLIEAFTKLGVVPVPSDNCGRSLFLSINADVQCGRNAVGYNCTLMTHGELKDCKKKEVITQFEFETAKGSSSNDEEKAKSKMKDSISRPIIQKVLEAKLKDYLPFK